MRSLGVAASMLSLLVALISTLGCGEVDAVGRSVVDVPVRSKVLLSPVYTVDRKYPSMKGPYSSQQVQLAVEGEPAEGSEELVWVTGYEATMVGADGETAMPQDFMCHSNLDINVQDHHRRFGNLGFNPRLFTLSQGQLSIQFPPGFGIPIMSSETLSLTTQVLNHNIEGESFAVRHRVAISFVRDADLSTPMTPLFPASGYGLALLEGDGGYYGVPDPDPEQHGPGCLVGDNAASHQYEDRQGRKFTGHWVVKPGREVNRTLVTELMQIPYETTLHYIAVHLHPFAESLELKDMTTGETLFTSQAENHGDRIGLARVDYLSSIEGIAVYPDHDYEIVSTYNNTTDQEQDSMAVMYLYLKDQRFDRGDRLLEKMAEARAKLKG